MAYLPEWERLAEALERVVAAGALSTDEAKRDICRAIADQKIMVRPRVEFIKRTIVDHQMEHHFAGDYGRYVRELRDRTIPLEMPSQLTPLDLDWEQSCFKSEWNFQPGMKGFPGPPREARVGIELSSSDVMRLFCDEARLAARKALSEAIGRCTSAKSRGVLLAVGRLWPDGIPPGLSAKERNKKILAQMERDGSSISTSPERQIQRAFLI